MDKERGGGEELEEVEGKLVKMHNMREESMFKIMKEMASQHFQRCTACSFIDYY